jgi:aspartyl/asparaginyl beta-hydroxylase (cupin superfamily)
MTPSIEKAFSQIRRQHGPDSLARVEQMLNSHESDRHPLQRGAKYVLPGVSQKTWHDPYAYPELLPFVQQLERWHPRIKEEFGNLWSAATLASYRHYLMTRDDWKAFYIYSKENLVSAARQRTPLVYRIVKEHAVKNDLLCPLLECHFSTLMPGATIPKHCDLWNFSINLHLAVDIPAGCGITVGGETRLWQEGRCLLFDYSFVHEAWNKGTAPRTCLLVDLWHPEVTIPERKALLVFVKELRKLTPEKADSHSIDGRWSFQRLMSWLRSA